MELDKFLSDLNEGKLPNSPLSDLRAKAYTDVYTHSSGNKLLLQKVIERLRPSEALEVQKYRVETIEPVTKEPIYEAFGIINRSANNQKHIRKLYLY